MGRRRGRMSGNMRSRGWVSLEKMTLTTSEKTTNKLTELNLDLYM